MAEIGNFGVMSPVVAFGVMIGIFVIFVIGLMASGMFKIEITVVEKDKKEKPKEEKKTTEQEKSVDDEVKKEGKDT